jgi:signal transduction histidine kinase
VDAEPVAPAVDRSRRKRFPPGLLRPRRGGAGAGTGAPERRTAARPDGAGAGTAARAGAVAWPGRRGPGGLQWRLAALIAVVSALVAGVLGPLAAITAAEQRLELNRKIVLARLERALDTFASTSAVAGDDIALDHPGLPPALAARVAAGRAATQLADEPDGPVLWAAAGFGDRVLSVRADYRLEQAADQRLNRTIVALAVGSASLVSVLGLLLASPLSATVRRVSGTAREIAGGRLDTRIGAVRGSREITELAASVDQMAASLEARLRAEQRFAADVTHELRTPAAGLLAAAEILPESHETELVRDRVEALCDLIEDLLEVSRLAADVDSGRLEPHRLTELLQRAVASTGLPAELRLGQDTPALTEPRRLERIVVNLVANAHRHGAAPVVLTLDRGAITVRDHGPGFPAELIAHGPRPFRTGTPGRGRGSGLGLAIATGHAHLIGAELTFTNAPDGGAVATLRLPLDDTTEDP